MSPYGKELIIDLHHCNTDRFNRPGLRRFFAELCNMIDMKRGPLHFWDYEDDDQEDYDEAPDHMKGTTAIQFIYTSNITIHALDAMKTAHLNIFSCKDFDPNLVERFCLEYFGGSTVQFKVVDRI